MRYGFLRVSKCLCRVTHAKQHNTLIDIHQVASAYLFCQWNNIKPKTFLMKSREIGLWYDCDTLFFSFAWNYIWMYRNIYSNVHMHCVHLYIKFKYKLLLTVFFKILCKLHCKQVLTSLESSTPNIRLVTLSITSKPTPTCTVYCGAYPNL